MKSDNKSLGYYTLLHELLYVIGIGTMWNEFISNNCYYGKNALREYRDAIDNQSVIFVPIEDDVGRGTAGGHPEEPSKWCSPSSSLLPISLSFLTPAL